MDTSFEVNNPNKAPKKKRKTGCIIAVIILLLLVGLISSPFIFIYLNSLYQDYQEEKYGGHGFDYMHGYSSTDFTGYHVYDGEKLVALDHPAPFMIEAEEDMPVLDGAEACYPVYTAVAKALYKDIDKIEKDVLDEIERIESKDAVYYDEVWDWRFNNGKIVTFTNTVYGYDRLIAGEVDLFFGARPSEKMKSSAKYFNEQIVSIPIGREAFVFFVEEDNPVESLTVDELRKIYSGEITNWSEVGGKNQQIIAFQRPEEAGSQVMMKYFMGDVPLMEPDKYTVVDAMGGVIESVKQYRNERGAIGYTFQYFLTGLNQEKGVKMISIDGVYPSVEHINDGTYPATVSLVCAKLASNDKPNVQRVIDFLLSEDGQRIIEETGYGSLPKDESGKPISEPIVENEIAESVAYRLDGDSREETLFKNESVIEINYQGKRTKFTYMFNEEDRIYYADKVGKIDESYPFYMFEFVLNPSDKSIVIKDVHFDETIVSESDLWRNGEISKDDFPKQGDRYVVDAAE